MSDEHELTIEEVSWPEERFSEGGWENGVRDGGKAGYLEGFHLGLEKGSEVGKELGFISGCLLYWKTQLKPEETKHKATKTFASLEKMIHEFPLENPQDERLFELMEKIRAKFRLLNSQLETNIKYNPVIQLSF